MNILLLNPPYLKNFSRTSRSPGVSLGGTLYYPFWLAYSAGVLESQNFSIRLIDAAADGISLSEAIEQMRDFTPELIVIDTSTPSIYNDIEVANQLKDTFPLSFIVLVGTHPSALPHETINLSDRIDAVAIGEYDYTLRDLATCLANNGNLGEVQGIVFRHNGTINQNERRSLIENIDELPFVSHVYKRHLNIRNYFFAAADYPMVMIITGRGCPQRCFFCLYPQTFHSREYRPRSASSVVAEFEFIVKKNTFI